MVIGEDVRVGYDGARHQGQELSVVAAVEGEIFYLLGVDDAGDFAGGGVERLDGAALNFDDLCGLAERKDEVRGDLGVGGDGYAGC